MSKLEITHLTPRTPYQTYLEERLQSAAGLGWSMPARESRAAPSRQPRHDPVSELGAVPPLGKPA